MRRMKFIRSANKAAAMGEYAFIVALIVVALLGTVYLFGLKVSDRFENVNAVLEKVQTPEEIGNLSSGGGYSGEPEDAPYPVLWGIGSYDVQDSNVSVTSTFAAGTKETDLLVAFVMHRGDLTKNSRSKPRIFSAGTRAAS